MTEGQAKETMQEITAASTSQFPGFKFSPTDEEIITYYLWKKLEGCGKSVEVIAEVEICRHEPWDLPARSLIHSENEWFFFSARGRKYLYGTQSRRATELGYWKATGKERNVKAGNRVIGTKRTLVFHNRRALKGERTEWIMHEFCLVGKSQEEEDMAYDDDVDDYLSYVLNDDLILLDETATSNIPTFEPLHQEPLQEVYPDFTSLPGITTATQTIRPSDPTYPPNNDQGGGEEYSSDDNEKSFVFSWSRMCIFKTMVAGKMRTRRLMSGGGCGGLIAVVLAYSIGGWWQV